MGWIVQLISLSLIRGNDCLHQGRKHFLNLTPFLHMEPLESKQKTCPDPNTIFKFDTEASLSDMDGDTASWTHSIRAYSANEGEWKPPLKMVLQEREQGRRCTNFYYLLHTGHGDVTRRQGMQHRSIKNSSGNTGKVGKQERRERKADASHKNIFQRATRRSATGELRWNAP
jgi:hypothetical protein